MFSWSLIRFNPFSEVGGHHSFVLTLLDMHKNGVVLTGLHGRGLTRFYTKLVPMDFQTNHCLTKK